MSEPNPYDPPKVAVAPTKVDLLKSKSFRKEKFQFAAMLLLGAVLISLPTILPPGDMIRDFIALGMTGIGLTFLISAIFN